MLEKYQKEFIEFAIQKDVLQFGKFELKSGRISPYFFNSGLFNTGEALLRLGHYYASALLRSERDFDMLMGPAYKGIPLVSSTAIALARDYDRDVPYAFNRKETKNHGEGGDLVGATLTGRVVIIDDVITAGTAIREVIGLLANHDARPESVVVAIDRQERGQGKLSAIQEVEKEFDLEVISVVNLRQIMEFLEITGGFATELSRIRDYQSRYGIAE